MSIFNWPKALHLKAKMFLLNKETAGLSLHEFGR